MLYRGKIIGPEEKFSLKYINDVTPVFCTSRKENYLLHHNLVIIGFLAVSGPFLSEFCPFELFDSQLINLELKFDLDKALICRLGFIFLKIHLQYQDNM